MHHAGSAILSRMNLSSIPFTSPVAKLLRLPLVCCLTCVAGRTARQEVDCRFLYYAWLLAWDLRA